MAEEFDVVVVGSGAGGSPVAVTLAEAGASVLLLERGPRYERKDFIHDEIRIARREFFVPSADLDPHIVAVKDQAAERTNEGWVASCVGGGTVHMSGFFYRFQESDFRARDFLGEVPGAQLANWPISYNDMAPYYDRVEREVGVSGPLDEGPYAAPKQAPYPFPPLMTHPAASLIDASAKKLGIHIFQTPRAIVTQPVGKRGQCVYCHLCGSFGCEAGAKSSTLETLIPRAEATGKCTVRAHSFVYDVLVDQSGKVKGVLYRDKQGQTVEIRARAVVLACSTIQTIRLLLLSKSAAFPEGLANQNGQVGKYLMFSTLSKAHGSFLFAKDAARAELLKDHAPFVGRSVLDFYLPKEPGAPKKAGALNFLLPSGGPISQSEAIAGRTGPVVWGNELRQRLSSYWHDQKQIDCETFGEYLANAGTYVELDTETKDQFGFAAPRIHIDRHPHDYAVADYLAKQAVKLFENSGADRVWTSNMGGRTMHLPMGGCRMGTDEQSSVVDENCRAHGIKNLYVADGSVFPSSGGVPPTFTILANSFRVGDALKRAFVAREL